MSEIRDSILRAVDLLHTKGWIQGQAESSEGLCLVYALMAGTQFKKNPAIFEQALTRVAWCVSPGSQRQPSCLPLTGWNDEPGRTLGEVIAVLTKAAEIGEPEKRRVLIPTEVPATPLSPDSPVWSEPAPEDPNPVKAPERVPA